MVRAGKTKQEVERQALLVAEPYGLVKGRSRYGIRVRSWSDQFDKTFRLLRPPQQMVICSLYKLGPMPPSSASSDTVAKFLTQIGWTARVLKMLSPSFWLVGASGAPPPETPACNGQPLLLTPVKDRQRSAPVIQASGPLAPAEPRSGSLVGAALSGIWPIGAKHLGPGVDKHVHSQMQEASMEAALASVQQDQQAAKDRAQDQAQHAQHLQKVQQCQTGLASPQGLSCVEQSFCGESWWTPDSRGAIRHSR